MLIVIGVCGNGALSFDSGRSAALPTAVLILTSGAALIFSNQLYKYNPLSKIMIFSLLSPVLGVFSSAIMLGDPLNSGYVFASLIIQLRRRCTGYHGKAEARRLPAHHQKQLWTRALSRVHAGCIFS